MRRLLLFSAALAVVASCGGEVDDFTGMRVRVVTGLSHFGTSSRGYFVVVVNDGRLAERPSGLRVLFGGEEVRSVEKDCIHGQCFNLPVRGEDYDFEHWGEAPLPENAAITIEQGSRRLVVPLPRSRFDVSGPMSARRTEPVTFTWTVPSSVPRIEVGAHSRYSGPSCTLRLSVAEQKAGSVTIASEPIPKAGAAGSCRGAVRFHFAETHRPSSEIAELHIEHELSWEHYFDIE
jgi:hypothetical protein